MLILKIIAALIPCIYAVFLALGGISMGMEAFWDFISLLITPITPWLIIIAVCGDYKLKSNDSLSLFGDLCVGFGIIGTLVGFVILLAGMAVPPPPGVDPAARIGAAMAVALITLLYGFFFKYVFVLPILTVRKMEKDSGNI